MISPTILAIYSVLITAALVIAYFRWRHDDASIERAKKLFHGCTDPAGAAAMLTAIAVAEEKQRPWFERALSIIGVVAFIAMTVTAAIQTVKATVEEVRAEKLQLESA